MLPDRLVFRDLANDYGLDGEVEEFADGEATGLRFFVQIKATDEADLKKALRVRVKLSTANYFRVQAVPVLMVRYLAAEKQLFARWFHLFDPYYEHLGDTHLTFTWNPERDLLVEESMPQMLSEAAAVMEAKSSKIALPIRVAVSTPDHGAFSFSPAEIELGIRAAASRCSELVKVVEEFDDHLVSLTVNDELFSSNVAGLASLTFHVDELPGIDDVVSLGSELFACTTVALARAGHADVAARLAAHFFPASFIALIPPMSLEVAEAMAYAGRAAEALEVSEELDSDDGETARFAAMTFLLSALRRGVHLREAERERLVETMKARMERREAAGDLPAAASEAVGLGNYYRAIREFPAAIEAYERALELDPNYRAREHLWRELAGAYFLAGRYRDSADAYAKAQSVAEAPSLEVEACRADALMYAGHFEEAYQLFEPIVQDETHLGAWAATKLAALHWVIRTTGARSQDRRPAAAEKLAGEFAERSLEREEIDALSAEIWELDAVSPLGWFNLARDFLDNGQEEAALFAYLTTAVMQEGDVEAWVNVVILATRLDDWRLASAAIVTAARLNHEAFLLELTRQAKAAFSSRHDLDRFLAGVNELIGEVLPEESEDFEVRFVNQGQPVESIHLAPPGQTP
jgi:tetratricopeptide (TPR) repeat protein